MIENLLLDEFFNMNQLQLVITKRRNMFEESLTAIVESDGKMAAFQKDVRSLQ